jgi:pSer/pThr/pTyr-binding forkhead associated (FHA) protein
MAKLVVLSPSMAGRSQELNVDKTTIGRVEDNTFQIGEPSVSSHHCEIQLRNGEVVVKDLNSTNGTFINGEKVTERVLKPGEVLRLGQIELRLESDGKGGAPAAPSAPAASSTPAPSGAPSAAPSKKVDQTMVMQRGVSLDEQEKGPRGTFDSKGFSKKDNKINKIFVIAGIGFGVVIVLLVLYIWHLIGHPS